MELFIIMGNATIYTLLWAKEIQKQQVLDLVLVRVLKDKIVVHKRDTLRK